MIEDDEMAEVSVPGYVDSFVSKCAEKLSKQNHIQIFEIVFVTFRPIYY